MANQATAKTGEEYEIDSKNRVLLERANQQREDALGKNQRTDSKIKAEQKILTGEDDNIVDFLEYKAKKVQDTINKMSSTLTDDPNRQEAAKKVLEKIVGDDELTTEDEKVKALTKAAFGDENTTENEIEAKKAVVSAKGMGLKDPTGVGLFKKEKLGDNLIEEGEKENGPLTDKEKGLLKRKAELINKVGSGIDNQSEVLENYKDNPGEARNNFRKLGVMTGLAMKSPKETADILAENEKINKSLGNKIPRNPRLAAFDEVAALVNRNAQTRKLLGTVQGGRGSFLIRFKMFFYNFSQGWVGGGVQSENGFITRVGGQSAGDFTQNSMGLLMGMDFKSSMDRILRGMAGKGVNAALMAKNLAGVASGPVGWLSTAAGFLKKFFGGLGSKLGLGIKKGLGNGFDKTSNGLLKLAGGLGLLLSLVGGGLGLGVATASTIGVGVGVGVASLYTYNRYNSMVMVSGLVSAKKDCDSITEYVDNKSKPGIPCSNMDQYTKEMQERITAVGYQTRCAVVVAAQYLVTDFPYHIPYKWGGYYYGDGISNNWCGGGMDCNSFIVWAYRQGGFAMTKSRRSETWRGEGQPFATERIVFNQDNCARIKEVAKPGDIVEEIGIHKAIVIGVDSEKLTIAQEGSAGDPYGLNICFLNPCTGRGVESGLKHGCYRFDEYWSMDNFFNYYTSGGKSINNFKIEPNSEIRSLNKDIVNDVNNPD